MSRGAILAERWFCEPPPNQQSADGGCWGFHTLRGGFDPVGLRFRPRFVRVVDVFRRVEVFMIRGWDLIVPRCGGTSTFPRETTLAAR